MLGPLVKGAESLQCEALKDDFGQPLEREEAERAAHHAAEKINDVTAAGGALARDERVEEGGC